jgi:multidrug efflux pump subunit AcrB
VLAAVFGPMAFFAGSTGVIYRQFSVTIIAAMLLSVVVALVLTPVLCATLLKPVPKGTSRGSGDLVPAPVLPLVRPAFSSVPRLLLRLVGTSLAHRKFRYVVDLLLIVVAGWASSSSACRPPICPTKTRASDGAGHAPTGSTLEQTKAVMKRVRNHFHENEKDAVKLHLTVSGVSFSGRGQNVGLAFVKLKDWELRNGPAQGGGRRRPAMGEVRQIRNAMVFAFRAAGGVELGRQGL